MAGLLNIFKKDKKGKEKKKDKEVDKAKKQEETKPADLEVKKKEKTGKKAEKKDKEEKKKAQKDQEKDGKKLSKPLKKDKKKIPEIAYRILIAPHISEKATILSEENKYVFKVSKEANKIEIKKAVEEVYGVDVVKVRIINVHRKRRRLGRYLGWRKGYKKAIVTIKKDQKIELLLR